MTEKNKSFFFGLAVGIVVIVVAGWIVSAFGDSNKTGSSYDDWSKLEGSADNDNSSGSDSLAVGENDHVRGNMDAPVTIVEFSDFQCSYCSRFHNTMKQIIEKYPNKVRWVYRHFPLDSIHPNARSAAEASECAAEQGKFWEYADRLVENKHSLDDNIYSLIADDLGLNKDDFEDCLTSRKYKNKIINDYQLGIKSGVKGTPGNFINGKSYPGALPFEQIESIINNL